MKLHLNMAYSFETHFTQVHGCLYGCVNVRTCEIELPVRVKLCRSGGLPASRWIRWVSKNIDVQMERKRFWLVDISLQTERSRTSAWDDNKTDTKLIGGEETFWAVTKVPPTGCLWITHTSRLYLALSCSLIFLKLLLAGASWRKFAWEGVLGFV